MKQVTLNASEMKSVNRRLILDTLRQQSSSRAELSRRTGLTRAAIGVIADQMLQEGVLREGGAPKAYGGIGRKSLELEINPDVFYAIGLNISRHDFSIGISDFAGSVHRHIQKPLDSSMPTSEILENISVELDRIISPPLLPGRLLGLGITTPGPIDVRRGVILNPPNFEKWSNIPIVDYFTERIHTRVLLENNANALALAEKTYGLKGTYSSFLELVVDTGVGAGLIINNELFKGTEGFGNEIGHTTIQINGPRCGCGNYGCVELYASIPNLIAVVKKTDVSLTSWKEISDQAQKGGKTAEAAMNLEAEYLACAIVNAVNVLDVQAVVLTGDISYRAEALGERISRKVNERFIARGAKRVEIISSRLLMNPVILSSANLILENYVKTGE